MSLEIALMMLGSGKTGDQLLTILDAIANEVTGADVAPAEQYASTPTLEPIQF